MTQRHGYGIAAKLKGLWVLSTVSLVEWQWLYLTKGLHEVNLHRFHQGKDTNGVSTLISEKKPAR